MAPARGFKIEDALLNEVGLELARFAGKEALGAIFAELRDAIEGLGVECGLNGLKKRAIWLSVASRIAYQWVRVASHMRSNGFRKTVLKIVKVLASRLRVV